MGKEEKYLLEVCEADILVNIEAFNLMEEAMGTSTHGFVAINATWAKNANGWLRLLHHSGLHTTGVAAKDDIRMRLHEERVLHIASWMIISKIQTAVYVPIILHFRTFSKREAKTTEDIDDFVLDNRQRMT